MLVNLKALKVTKACYCCCTPSSSKPFGHFYKCAFILCFNEEGGLRKNNFFVVFII